MASATSPRLIFSRVAPAPLKSSVYFCTPGGVSAAGGIVGVARNTTRYWPPKSSYRLVVLDTYGPGSKALMPLFFMASAARLLLGLLRGDVAILHLNMAERLSVWRKLSLVRLAKLFSVPVILHLHGADFAEYYAALGPRRRVLIDRTMRSCDRIIVLGKFWHRLVTGQIGIDPAAVVILPNAVPLIDAALPPAPNDGICRYLFLGVVGPRKGFDTLIEALATPALAARHWRLIVAGGGEVARYRDIAAAAGLSARIQFLGHVDETSVAPLFDLTPILVLPSRNEGLPLAILEAMGRACPIISTPVGSIPDAVIDGETGLLVPTGNADALAQAMASLADDPARARAMGAAGRARFDANFAMPGYIARLETIYDAVSEPDQALHLRER
jgi:glycosyltransferase involved in cell wall biosynthesis